MSERGEEGPREPEDRREKYRKGLPDHHDPTGGFAGAPPAYSALTLRIILAGLGLLMAAGSAIWLYATDGPMALVVVLAVVAVGAAVNLAVVLRRKLRGEPG